MQWSKESNSWNWKWCSHSKVIILNVHVNLPSIRAAPSIFQSNITNLGYSAEYTRYESNIKGRIKSENVAKLCNHESSEFGNYRSHGRQNLVGLRLLNISEHQLLLLYHHEKLTTLVVDTKGCFNYTNTICSLKSAYRAWKGKDRSSRTGKLVPCALPSPFWSVY